MKRKCPKCNLKQNRPNHGFFIRKSDGRKINRLFHALLAMLSTAKSKNLPVIIDFSAEWCVACKELEHITFVDKNVISAGKNFTLLRFDATESTDKLDELKKKYKVLGLPTVLFIDNNGNVKNNLTLTGFEEAPEFLQRMMKVLTPKY